MIQVNTMSYDKRLDGRAWTQMRPIEAKVGVIKNAQGSAYFKIGKTAAYAAVYSPRNLHPKFMQNPSTGILRCFYNMMPFSGQGDRVRPGGSRRSKEISMVTEKAISPVLNLTEYPNTTVDVFIELPQTDAGSRCAGICAASMALADAGLAMKDLVAAIAVGKVDDKIVVDLDYAEESYEGGEVADIATAWLPNSDQLTLLQCDGVISREELKAALVMGLEASKRLYEIQKAALKEKFQVKP